MSRMPDRPAKLGALGINVQRVWKRRQQQQPQLRQPFFRSDPEWGLYSWRQCVCGSRARGTYTPMSYSWPLRCLGGLWCSPRGVVPFLGTFLTDLFMLDTAMEEYLEGNEVNHRKKNKEYRVLTEILLLQVAADRYHIEPEQPFRAWFQAGTWLSEDESYTLSCQLEPRACPQTGGAGRSHPQA
ncbi:unnamed protein product [Nyctereutes procyonoides]|uniref:(raccoon dog) hypothetical protein n=1 Tax=Nyctereutes procyonoides TaxID=34880 RepID=A0A811XWN0_NYCPR|nr:unnamed protein product [Nyctereutes procyonoides]CAD7668998.1 unnamed protein product [Nyctereutes procyonoides]CAD7669000.1 unnamed protein product [Nyctereutes procyonoides]CAD7669002.1 unnamed protein product [Nyctereutes procyonoides]